jgi:predicted 3-demethylubiquinone-9 3-methyltransferase (glyoxalase superfamily)
MQKITPFLWFDNNAEEAMNFYISIFKNSEVLSVTRNGDAGPGPKGTVMYCTFRLEGQTFMALNGGPMFQFTEAISLFVDCKNQEEVDDLWDKLSVDGKGQCGWLKDRFGLSWQIVPRAFMEMMTDFACFANVSCYTNPLSTQNSTQNSGNLLVFAEQVPFAANTGRVLPATFRPVQHWFSCHFFSPCCPV